MAKGRSITPEQMDKIANIEYHFGFDTYQIADRVGLSQSTVSRLLKLKRMAERGERLSFNAYVKDQRIGKSMEEWARRLFKPVKVRPRRVFINDFGERV